MDFSLNLIDTESVDGTFILIRDSFYILNEYKNVFFKIAPNFGVNVYQIWPSLNDFFE